MTEQNSGAQRTRKPSIQRPIRWTHDWVVAGLACPALFVILRALDFPYWEWIFLGTGVVFLFLALVLKAVDRFSLRGRNSRVTWMGEFAIGWFAAVAFVYQMLRFFD